MKKMLFHNSTFRQLCLLLTAALAIGASAATVDMLHAGYCEGQADAEGSIIFNDATQVSACVLLDDSVMSRFAGNQMVAINYYLTSKLSVSSLTLWVRATPDGENLVEKSVAKSELTKGWNHATLDVPMDINGEARYVGYTYTQSRAAYVVATTPGTHAGGLLLKVDEGEWSETTGSLLALECEVQGDNLPQWDARIDQIAMSKDKVKLGHPVGVNGVVSNMACQPFNSINVTCTSAGMAPMTFEVPLDQTISYRESCNFGFSFVPDYSVATDDIAFTVTINTVDNNQDEYADNSTRILTYAACNQDYSKRLVIEEFTSESCIYCPNAAARLAQALEERPGRAVGICHHAGFYVDQFTVYGVDDSLTYWFSIQSAPTFMYDRTAFDGEYQYNPSDYQDFVDVIDYVTGTDAQIEVNAFASVDKQAHTITVTVDGDVSSDFADASPSITVFLLENDVPAIAQKDQYGDVIEGFLHQHIIRDYNACWGEPLDISNGSYAYTYTFNYDPQQWDYNNLYVAAFVNQCGVNKDEKQIYNADQIELKYIGSHYAGSSDVLAGDVNGDGEVNVNDVNAVIDMILSDSTVDAQARQRADLNGDGEINISDVNAIIDLILK